MARTKTKAESVWKDGFLFVGNDLALDFLNTRPVQDGEAMELLPDFAALLRWLQAQGCSAHLANADRDRVRKCDQCVLHFVDTSKKGTRRWCSMRLCGNRLKVAAYAARRRSASVER